MARIKFGLTIAALWCASCAMSVLGNSVRYTGVPFLTPIASTQSSDSQRVGGHVGQPLEVLPVVQSIAYAESEPRCQVTVRNMGDRPLEYLVQVDSSFGQQQFVQSFREVGTDRFSRVVLASWPR